MNKSEQEEYLKWREEINKLREEGVLLEAYSPSIEGSLPVVVPGQLFIDSVNQRQDEIKIYIPLDSPGQNQQQIRVRVKDPEETKITKLKDL